MPATVERIGRAAAPGLAYGPVHRIAERIAATRRAGSRAEERTALDEAMAEASREIAELGAAAEGDGADILEFQIVMLADEALAEPAIAEIAAGADAATAWTRALDGQIEIYQSGDDSYFAARATDLADLRDRVLAHLLPERERDAIPPGAVLLGRDLTPSRFLAVDWTRGGAVALSEGSPSSHVAMLARSRGIPMVVGLGEWPATGPSSAIVDGDAGRLVLDPGTSDLESLAAARAEAAETASRAAAVVGEPAVTADGEHVAILINIAGSDELAAIDPANVDGIGLVRTEFLFGGAHGLPNEEMQYRAYRRMLEWAAGRPVTIRTVDAGGDKPVPGLTIDGEANPFLGVRGIRLSLAKPEIFRVQLRALCRAAVHGNLKVMLPMVTVPAEIDAAAALLDAEFEALRTTGVASARPPLGIMVEVPAVAVVPEIFATAAFFSIGSNDLTQYATAAARDNPAVATLGDSGHPAVIALVANVVAAAAKLGVEVSLCGDMGGDVRHLPALIRAGLRSVSVAPPLVGSVKLALRDVRAGASR